MTKLSGKDFDLSDDRKYPWIERTYGFIPVDIERFEGVSEIITKIRIKTVSVTGIAYNIIISGFVDTEKFIEIRQKHYESNTKPWLLLSHSGLDVLKKAERDLANFCQKSLPMGIIQFISKDNNLPSLWVYSIYKYENYKAKSSFEEWFQTNIWKKTYEDHVESGSNLVFIGWESKKFNQFSYIYENMVIAPSSDYIITDIGSFRHRYILLIYKERSFENIGSFFEDPLIETSRLYLLICWSVYRYLNSEDFKPEPLQIDIEKPPTYQTLKEYDGLLKETIKHGVKTREFVDLIKAEIDSIETLIKNFNGYTNEKPSNPIYGSFIVSNELIGHTQSILERLKSKINEYIKVSDNNIIELHQHIDVSSSMINLNLQNKIYVLTMVIIILTIILTIVQLQTEILNIISYLIESFNKVDIMRYFNQT